MPAPRVLRVAFPGLLRQPRLARILELRGQRLAPGMALRAGEANAIWDGMPTSRRLATLARRVGGGDCVSLGDGFLRSIHPGHMSEGALSILIDPLASAHARSRRSELERMIEEGEPLDDALRARARAGIERLRALGLSQTTPVPRGWGELPEPGYVLVVDQARDDPAALGCGVDARRFREMLLAARAENAGKRIVIAAAPSGRGHLGPADLAPGDEVVPYPFNPWDVVERAERVYAVSALAGFEAALAGRQAHLFGLPFYAGWGFTEDRERCERRTARRSAEEVFAFSHLLCPTYYDPFADRLTTFEKTVDNLAGLAPRQQTRPGGDIFVGFHRWKRRGVLRFRPRSVLPTVFENRLPQAARRARAEGRRLWLWASRFEPDAVAMIRAQGIEAGLVEDGFLRSVGLGARHIDAVSLVFDPDGIYYDPARPSRLETLIAEAAGFATDDDRLARAAALRARVVAERITKYNLAARDMPPIPPGRRVVLVPGQVEDDASVRRGTSSVHTNVALLERARAANPDAVVIYKPHPDVEAGLRRGRVPDAEARRLADHVAVHASADALMSVADEVWTMTSLMGFEALIRGKAVATLGAPFYAGWGLTRDLGDPPERRNARASLDALVWATLIAYPAYVDPLSGLPCEPELAVSRLALGSAPRLTPLTWVSARAQDVMAALGLVWWR